MGIKLTLTLAPTRRSARIAARAHRARHQPYPARQPSGSQPTPPPQPRASSPVMKEESRASSPIIKREESSSPPPLNTIPFTPINAAAAVVPKREHKPKKEDEESEEGAEEAEEEEKQEHDGELTLHAIPQYFPALGPNDPSRSADPRYIPGNLVIDEEGVERRVLGRGEVATLSTMECWENGDLF